MSAEVMKESSSWMRDEPRLCRRNAPSLLHLSKACSFDTSLAIGSQVGSGAEELSRQMGRVLWQRKVKFLDKSRGILFATCVHLLSAGSVHAQSETSQPLPTPPSAGKDEAPVAPGKVDVQPLAQDEEIRKRLLAVLDATGWFVEPQVKVEDGVVFLGGRMETDKLKTWAGNLARNTQDVVAVVNQIEVREPSVWTVARAAGKGLWLDVIRSAWPMMWIGA